VSWSLRLEGTAEEIREAVHHHEAVHWRAMPLAERLVVHHLVGHAVEQLDEHARGGPSCRYFLVGNGGEYAPGANGSHHLEWGVLRAG
jgi:predicted RNA-binding protein Jag